MDSSCHRGVAQFEVSHLPVVKKRCISCHIPKPDFDVRSHSLASFLPVGDPRKLCLTCHDAPLKNLTGDNLHAPVREEGCLYCHRPHGSDLPFLLHLPFPRDVQTRFRMEKYGLCWECHDSSLATEKFTDSATSFRKGTRNFHYSHLFKGRGMSCLACHGIHGSIQDAFIRSEGPAGKGSWKVVLTFESTDLGGTCTGGCHTRITYKR